MIINGWGTLPSKKEKEKCTPSGSQKVLCVVVYAGEKKGSGSTCPLVSFNQLHFQISEMFFKFLYFTDQPVHHCKTFFRPNSQLPTAISEKSHVVIGPVSTRNH